MVLKKLLASLGAGAPSVETTLQSTDVYPGGTVTGRVVISGGEEDLDIESVSVELVTRMEDYEADEHAWAAPYAVQRVQIAGGFHLDDDAQYALDFSIAVPWESPLTHVGGRRLRGARVGIRTELAVDMAVDQGDLDEIAVHAVPAQETLLNAFAQLGWLFEEAEVKPGRARHTEHKQLPLWQEIELVPPPHFTAVKQLECVFVTRPDSMDLVLGSALAKPISFAELDQVNWPQRLDGWLHEAFGRFL